MLYPVCSDNHVLRFGERLHKPYRFLQQVEPSQYQSILNVSPSMPKLIFFSLSLSLRVQTVRPSRIWRTWVPSPHFSPSWRMDRSAMEPASCCMERQQVSSAALSKAYTVVLM